jgi:plasmid stabilization system protein ParE
MPGNVRKSPAARRDLLEHFVYLARFNVPVARRFLRAADRTMGRIADMPEAGSPWESTDPALAGVRFWSVRGFRHYFIFYRVVPRGIEVIRVLYATQDIERMLGG